MIEKTIQSLRDFSAQAQLIEVAEPLCRHVLYKYLKNGQIGFFDLKNYFQDLRMEHFVLHNWRQTIHFGKDSPRLTLVFGIEILDSYNEGISAFEDFSDDSDTPRYWPWSVKCDMTFDLKPIQITIRDDDAHLFQEEYQQVHTTNEFWNKQLTNLEKQSKDTLFISTAQQACHNNPYGTFNEIEFQRLHESLYECSYTFITAHYEYGYFIASWKKIDPNTSSYEIYQYWMSPWGEYLDDMHQTRVDLLMQLPFIKTTP